MSQNTPNKPAPKVDPEKGKAPRFPIWIYLVILLLLLSIPYMFSSPDAGNKVEYSTFLKHVQSGYVDHVLIVNNVELRGKYKPSAVEEGRVEYNQPQESPWMLSQPDLNYRFTATMIEGDDLRPILDEHGVEYDAKIEENWFGGMIFWLIPLAIIIAFWVFIFRRMNPGSQVLNIGKNKAMLYDKQGENKVTFKDVAGLYEAKEEVEEVVEFLKNPEKFTKLGGAIPKGVLLVGPPGTGKTLMAKATAGEADVPFFSMSGSDFVEMFVGVGAARVRDLFKQAKEKAPCIIFIDEIDAIGRSRGRNQMMGSNDERENTLNQLLSEMDGFNTDKGVIMMAASNRPDVLDSALLRPGRFDRQILVDKPDLKGRIEVLEVHTKKIKISEQVDLQVLASQIPGFAGAEIANLCNEAALLAARRTKESVEMVDFQDAIERVVAGLEKKNKIISPDERDIVAYHEAGHAVVGWFLKHTDPVLKVSIVPRGFAALGYTLQTPLEDRFLMTTEELNDKICALLGGRVSEEIIFGKISTGAQNDLERIAKMAFAMVAQYGMSEELGYMTFYDSQAQDGGFGFSKKYSDETARAIDKAVKNIIDSCYRRTKELLEEKREDLEKLAKALLDKEILGSHDLIDLLGERPHGNYPVKKEDLDKMRNAKNGKAENKGSKVDEVVSDDSKEEQNESTDTDADKKNVPTSSDSPSDKDDTPDDKPADK